MENGGGHADLARSASARTQFRSLVFSCLVLQEEEAGPDEFSNSSNVIFQALFPFTVLL